MQQKIIDYVNYQFRFDKREDILSIKQEMISNLIDRFNDLIDQGYDEKSAYIETVKRIGNINETKEQMVDPIYYQKPTWALIAMVTVGVLAIGGFAVSIISNVVGLLITLGSIGLFSTASYALYVDSQHKRALEHDIDVQKVYFQSILKTFNKNYAFWAITIAIVFTSVILNYIILLTAGSMSEVVLNGGYGQIIAAFIVIWFIVFVILFAILKSFQGSLYKKYIHITGEPNIDDINSDSKTFVEYKQGYELILFLFLVLTTFAIWTSPVSYYEYYIGGGSVSFETTFIGAIGDFPFFIVPVIFSLALLIFMGINLKTAKMKKWGLAILSYISYILYLITISIYSEVSNGILETKTNAILIYLGILVLGQLVYFISVKKWNN